VSLDVDVGVVVERGSGAVPVGDVSAGDERGVNIGACVTGGAAEVSDPADDPGIVPDAEVVGLVRLAGGVGDSDVPVLPDDVLGFADVDHLTSESWMLMGAGGGGVSTPPGIMVLDKPGAGVHGVSETGALGVDMVGGV
jgi:hypothetical protein